MDVPDLEVRKQLFVGDGETKALGEAEKAIRGSAYVEGPLQIGKDSDYSGVEATLMVGAQVNTDSDARPENAIKAKGNIEIIGDTDQTGDMEISGDMTIGGTMKAGYATWSGSIVATTKLFDIQHPSKEDYRLAHACLEGPEHTVFYRGRVTNNREIVLPSYWEGLVDIDSITVQLTPIGAHQDLIVKRWDDKKIYLQPQGGMPINCFFMVMAERIDVDKLVVEYQGV